MEQTILRESVEKKRLVLIEDYKLIRIGIRMVLDGDEALQVVGEGETATQGLKLIQELQPELVILDLGLPDMNGFELTRQIRQANPDIKILILTSHETEEEMMQGLAAGANAYCLKDIISERLIEVVKCVCEGCYWLEPRLASRALHVFSDNHSVQKTKNRISLNPRERETLRLLVEGVSNDQITRALNLSIQATKTLIDSIAQKLALQEKLDATTRSLQQSFA